MRVVLSLVALVLVAPASASPLGGAAESPAAVAPFPIVVIAHVDTGINPYHEAFRDRGPLAYVHPSRYLAGFPETAVAVRLSLNESSYAAAVEKDAAVLASLARNTLYWFPGTRIVGAISLGAGGTNCPLVPLPPLTIVGGAGCAERIVLDDHGHGTMTASRMASALGSLAPEARIVSIEGLGAASVSWAAERGWIDVQSNSWLSLAPNFPRPPGLPSFLLSDAGAVGDAFEAAARRMITVAASGNGAAYLLGFAPAPTIGLSTAAPGVVLVGAHDNGRVAAWSGAPPHVVADGYAGLTASRDSITTFGPDPMACCTSAAAPYAAGGAAGIILDARRLTGDRGVGLRGNFLVDGAPFGAGVLADGRLTLAEVKDLLLRTAEARPGPGAHDGFAHWTAGGSSASLGYATTYGPGANPFCQGCWTAPVGWNTVPDAGVSAYPLVGFGAVNERSLAAAGDALRGADLPARSIERALFDADQAARAPLY